MDGRRDGVAVLLRERPGVVAVYLPRPGGAGGSSRASGGGGDRLLVKRVSCAPLSLAVHHEDAVRHPERDAVEKRPAHAHADADAVADAHSQPDLDADAKGDSESVPVRDALAVRHAEPDAQPGRDSLADALRGSFAVLYGVVLALGEPVRHAEPVPLAVCHGFTVQLPLDVSHGYAVPVVHPFARPHGVAGSEHVPECYAHAVPVTATVVVHADSPGDCVPSRRRRGQRRGWQQ